MSEAISTRNHRKYYGDLQPLHKCYKTFKNQPFPSDWIFILSLKIKIKRKVKLLFAHQSIILIHLSIEGRKQISLIIVVIYGQCHND